MLFIKKKKSLKLKNSIERLKKEEERSKEENWYNFIPSPPVERVHSFNHPELASKASKERKTRKASTIGFHGAALNYRGKAAKPLRRGNR